MKEDLAREASDRLLRKHTCGTSDTSAQSGGTGTARDATDMPMPPPPPAQSPLLGSGLVPVVTMVHKCVEEDELFLLQSIQAHLQAKIYDVMVQEMVDRKKSERFAGLAIKGSEPGGPPKKTTLKSQKLEVHRFETPKSGNVKLYFGGKVVEESIGRTLNRANAVPFVKPGEENDNPVFYVSSAGNNMNASFGCLAWCIPPVPASTRSSSKAKVKPPAPATHIVGWEDVTFTCAD